MMAYEPGLHQILNDFHAQDKHSLGVLSISIYTLGYCISPLIVAPVSEIYGRVWPLRVAYLVFPGSSSAAVPAGALPPLLRLAP